MCYKQNAYQVVLASRANLGRTLTHFWFLAVYRLQQETSFHSSDSRKMGAWNDKSAHFLKWFCRWILDAQHTLLARGGKSNAVIITSLVAEQRCVVHRICIATSLVIISVVAREPWLHTVILYFAKSNAEYGLTKWMELKISSIVVIIILVLLEILAYIRIRPSNM